MNETNLIFEVQVMEIVWKKREEVVMFRKEENIRHYGCNHKGHVGEPYPGPLESKKVEFTIDNYIMI